MPWPARAGDRRPTVPTSSAWISISSGRKPSTTGTTTEPGDVGLAVGEEQRRRVGHRLEAGVGHREEAEIVGGAEAVLDRPQQPEGVVAVALEGQHRVDEVLEHAGPGQRRRPS